MKVFALFGRPAFLRGFHGWCTVGWIPFAVLSNKVGWVNSNNFISNLSILALFLGSFSAWQAARVEVKQEEEIKK